MGNVERQQTLQARGFGEDIVEEEAVLLGAEEGNQGNICLGEEENRRHQIKVTTIVFELATNSYSMGIQFQLNRTKTPVRLVRRGGGYHVQVRCSGRLGSDRNRLADQQPGLAFIPEVGHGTPRTQLWKLRLLPGTYTTNIHICDLIIVIQSQYIFSFVRLGSRWLVHHSLLCIF